MRGCFFILAAVLVLPLMAGCLGQPNEINANFGQEFSLDIGQSASIAGDELDLRFLEVLNDSRCPEGAVCIWAGEATCLVEITYAGYLYREELTQPGLSEPFTTEFQEYEITFDLLPYPQEGEQIQNKDYRLQLLVNKKT
jgi:hypothetical protein